MRRFGIAVLIRLYHRPERRHDVHIPCPLHL